MRILLKKRNNHLETSGLNIFLSLAFLGMISIGFVSFGSALLKSENPDRSAIESYFDNIEYREGYINIYGLAQSILGKRQIENFTIFKNDYYKLVQPRRELLEEEIDSKVAEVGVIWKYLDNKKISAGYRCCFFVYNYECRWSFAKRT